MTIDIKSFYDPDTYTLTYVVSDPATKDAVIIDPVRDYNPVSSSVSDASAKVVGDWIGQQGLNPRFVLETHAHADHLSGSPYFKERFGTKTAIGAPITLVQETFKGVFALDPDFPTDGSQFDKLIEPGETFAAGSLSIQALHTPGHTPACMSFVIEDAVFTGDALFMPDYGVGRCDFPKGDAAALYHSVHDVLYALPDDTRVFVGHDYQPGGRAVAWETTIGQSKAKNVHLAAETSEAAFVEMRTSRDKTLNAPRLLYPSVQVNIDAGELPKPAGNGMRYLKIPVAAK